MTAFTEIKTILREKSGKKLVAVTAVTFLLITAIVLLATFKICENVHKNQMNGYLTEIPVIVDSSRSELSIRNRIYEGDVLTRTELGLKIYKEENGLTEAEELERVRKAVSAASLSLLDGQGKVIATTGAASPEDRFQACIQTLEPRKVHLEYYLVPSQEGEGKTVYDGKGFVMIPVPESGNQSLVFEYSCDSVLEIYKNLSDWSSMLSRILSSYHTNAYARTGDRLTGTGTEQLTPEQTAQLTGELTKIFQNSESAQNTGNGGRFSIVSLLGKRYLSAMMYYPRENTSVLVTVPLLQVIGNGIYIAVAILAIIAWGIVLLELYVYRRLRSENTGAKKESMTFKEVFRLTWPGLLTAILVTAAFSSMLLLLENRTTATSTAVTNREGLQYEINWRKGQENKTLNLFTDFYRTRSQTLAAFLAEHPDYQTRAGLEELNRIAGTDYLMRFDSTGQELVASNSYTGFTVGKNLSENYQAVLMGYPEAVVGPEQDPYSGKKQIGIAILMTNSAGQPDGFLLSVYSAEDLSAELKRMKLVNAVNTFQVQKGQVAAAISDADGTFIAHSDPKMIGLKAENYLTEVKPGSSYEGFATYDRTNVYVSAKASEGTTILYIVPESGDSYARMIAVLMTLAVVLILGGIYYPTAGVQSAQAMDNMAQKIDPSEQQRRPMLTFYDGYVVFMTLFAIAVMITTSNGWWTTFNYVFSGRWSKGVHLFSLWAAIFVLVSTLFCVYLIRIVLRRLEERFSLRVKTITRLVNSLVTYIAIGFLIFSILNMFGVNTTVLIASAGIVSIAVGMGAQSMAADLLAGFFMMMEGSIHVGDQVSVGGVKGCVTDMGIRVMEITDDNGNVVSLNNSKVTGVCNMSKNKEQKEKKNEPEKDAAEKPKETAVSKAK